MTAIERLYPLPFIGKILVEKSHPIFPLVADTAEAELQCGFDHGDDITQNVIALLRPVLALKRLARFE
jgi:hypothetical protein